MRWLHGLIFLVVCSGCAATEETRYLDREFGKAQLESWDKMIVLPDQRFADKQPEGMQGINAEAAMDVYHRSFSKAPKETNIIQFGVVDD